MSCINLYSRVSALYAVKLFVKMPQMTFGEQNTERDAHEQLSYAFDRGINALDTAEMVITPCQIQT